MVKSKKGGRMRITMATEIDTQNMIFSQTLKNYDLGY